MSRERLRAENLALRHQVAVLRRSAQKRLSLGGTDRFLFAWHYRLWPGVLNAIVIVKPETVVRWHRRGFRAFWRAYSTEVALAEWVRQTHDRTDSQRVPRPLYCPCKPHLRRLPAVYADNIYGTRTHLSLGKDTPFNRAVQCAVRI